MTTSVAPALSTPSTHIFEEETNAPPGGRPCPLSREEILIKYEIQRTLAEIRKARYSRVALQFPDNLLPDAPRVFEELKRGVPLVPQIGSTRDQRATELSRTTVGLHDLDISSENNPTVNYYILADTSYGACCVDEIAAEHVNADVVVHYGRACLSPTSRIPVIHVFTIQPLDQQDLLKEFRQVHPDLRQKVILMADVTYQSHLGCIYETLKKYGYTDLFATGITHDPSSPIPNRTVPGEVRASFSTMKTWSIFHISDPPQSLLLTLASRTASIRIFSTLRTAQDSLKDSFLTSTSPLLRRRYALLTSVTTVSIFGILINTLSVKNYLHIVEHVKSLILASGKKSYTFVVGKINAAKVANFSEIGAWVVIGCWESSLIESKDFWKPVLTPFEMELALMRDEERVWTGQWSSDFQKLLDEPKQALEKATATKSDVNERDSDRNLDEDYDSESESAPPEFDLRTGRYVSHSRPLQQATRIPAHSTTHNSSLIVRARGDLATVGGEASPGAEYLRSNRTWKGLGSDFEIAYEENGTPVEQGRKGIARGYAQNGSDIKT